MFLIMINYKQPLEVVDQYLVAHRSFLEEGYNNDYFIVSGPRNPRVGGIIISQLTDRDQLEKIIEQDPFLINNIADYEIIEFTPVKFHKGFTSFLA